MTSLLPWLFRCAWGGITLFGIAFFITSLIEKKNTTAVKTTLIFLPALLIFGIIIEGIYPYKDILLILLLIGGLVSLLVLMLPWGNNYPDDKIGKQTQLDERDAIFHRFYRLKPGMPEFDQFYDTHPELKKGDDAIRELPGLAGVKAESYNSWTTPFNIATFDVMEKLYQDIEWAPDPVEMQAITASPEEWSVRIKGFAHYSGADMTGITSTDPAYIYSHIGRSPGKWGAPINLDHPNAIVIGVEMDHSMIRHAPHHTATTESSRCYMKAGQTALVLARYIQRLGYKARAHIDGNYRVICPPLAVAAGLGELSRMGLVVTPEYGARIRFAVITTDLPLIHDKACQFGVQDFCEICKKCATNCPSGAVEKGDKKVVRGVLKWQSNQEKCFSYWNRVGSDCSICIKVCPYSHPNTPVHQIIRWGIRRNPVSRFLALAGDDFFYGRRPKNSFPLPDWHALSYKD
ncbi:reductive dehalogenase [bacterium]|nr:reductive dehalogenase [bacterium]